MDFKSIKLNNGVDMPLVGLGVFRIADSAECERAVLDAFEAGYRAVDTAAFYANERAVGNAVKKSGLKREDLFITTKVWIQDAGYENAKKSVLSSLEKLKLDYIDLVLVHQPFGDYYGTYRALKEFYNNNQIRAIGVSNFMPDRLTDLVLNTDIVPAVNQIELHPYHQRHEDKEIADRYGVTVQSWGQFAQGKLDVLNDETLLKIAKKHNKTVSQIIVRWLIERGIPAIPKSTNKARIIENFNVFDFSLDENDKKTILSIDRKTGVAPNHHDPRRVIELNGFKY